ncbi:biotin transporter BioY [Rhizobium sp. RU36D]|uniref:biotin transporter BioY n=1 Tax=Rhizobium sp. RU36D TaxID=1907415 RepID=UPI0009D890D5|nr:biotin transporter BioY [Rhizobium sp. RU36D]SMC91717.1 biotin transport system substrate-specific component [Rhizobium sp. RU36D]
MTTRDLVLTALFAAIIVALGVVPPIMLPLNVPISAQTLGVMLAGVVLGSRRGALAPVLVILLVAIGLPVLSGGRGGLAVFAGPTVGFLIGWVPGAFVTGLIAERFARRGMAALPQTLGFLAASIIGGIGVIYLFGIGYLAFGAGLGLEKAFLGSLAFIPGDVIKAAIAALAGRAVMVGYPLLPSRA